MLAEILKRQTYKDNPNINLYPFIERVKNLLDIPGLGTDWEQQEMWDYAINPVKRMMFRYWGFDKPKKKKR